MTNLWEVRNFIARKSEADKQIKKGDILWFVSMQDDSDSDFLHCKGTNER